MSFYYEARFYITWLYFVRRPGCGTAFQDKGLRVSDHFRARIILV